MRTPVDASSRPMDLPAAIEFSHYAQRARSAHPEEFAAIVAALDTPWSAWDDAAAELTAAPDAASLARALRTLREHVFLRTMLRDLTGRAGIIEVCQVTTALADLAVERAVDAHTAWMVAIHGEPRGAARGDVQRLQVIAMGKQGGAELNVSSDIDLIFAYPDEGHTDGAKPLPNQEFFDRLGRRVIAALDERTPDGFVFRVDMRLRPYGESGPLTCSYAALEQYLITQGRTWERYAWLKARPLIQAGREELMRLVTPFVYRKYLDFDALEGLRDVHRQIREQGRRRDYAANLKLGPGGIREIEFIVQALQLVRGGRDPGLRDRGTLPALTKLGARELLPASAVGELRDAYVFLRNVEHRLQYRDDMQTQNLPQSPDESLALSRASGFDAVGDFERTLDRHRRSIVGHFDVLFGETENDRSDPLVSLWLDPKPESEVAEALSDAGYSQPDVVIGALARLRNSARYLQLPVRSRQRFDALVPQLLRVATAEKDPQAVSLRLLLLLETVSRRSAYLALLVEHPPVLPRIAHLVGASAWAADYLSLHPILLDELLDSHALLTEPNWDDWRHELDEVLVLHEDDPEHQNDALRHFQHAQTFRLLAQDVSGRLTIERLADHLSALADVVLAATLRCCWGQVRGAETAPPTFAIIGYGKLGGKELGYASDLDIVFLYDDARDIAAERYARLAQRLNAWLTSATAAGRLYETDLRLRPDGVSGLLVSSLDAFRQYQRTQAWPWEHQALTRARFVAGDAAIGAAFEAERELILRLPRDRVALRAEVIGMRQKMQAAHPNPTRLFDVKHDRGGMVDIEFSVQYLVLANAHEHAALCRNAGNIALLQIAAGLGLVAPALAATAADAYREFRRVQHELRLQAAREARTDPAAQASRRTAVALLWRAVFGEDRDDPER